MNKANRDTYWRRTRRLTAGLFMVWVLVTFVMNWYARELNEIVIFGFPLGFYMGRAGYSSIMPWLAGSL
jgi:putative solute:sodium symporter small subunit